MSHHPLRIVRRVLGIAAVTAACTAGSGQAPASGHATARPLPPEYRVHDDGSVSLRVCYNWSCAKRDHVTFSARDMAGVAREMALCPDTGAHERLQRVRIGIWQMEKLAQKYQPLLANDEPVNTTDHDREGRMDCIDNSSNTTNYLSILRDLALIEGWTVASPEVRDRLSTAVHWTAVAVDANTHERWAVDSWFRGNGHLPFVLPLDAWQRGRIAWESPFDTHNPYPRYSEELCLRTASTAPATRARY